MRLHSFSKLLAVALLGCTSNTAPQPNPGTIQLTGSSGALVPGQALSLTASAFDADGAPLPGAVIAFSSSMPTIASVSAAGVVTALAPGSATITASGDGLTNAIRAVTVAEGAWLTTAGGTFSAYAGAVSMEVPAGAVTEPRALRIDRATTSDLEPILVPLSLFSFGDATDLFTVPVTLRLRIPTENRPIGLPVSQYAVRRYAATGWTDPTAQTVDASLEVASATIVAGGVYGVARAVPSTPCIGAEYRAFDFWLGDWDVYDGGVLTSRNIITAEPGGCAIFERYSTLGGGEGRSISFYEPVTALWYQTYVDNANIRVRMSGPVGAAGTLSMFTDGPTNLLFARWTWTLQPNGEVTQVSFTTLNGGASFSPPTWTGVYRVRP